MISYLFTGLIVSSFVISLCNGTTLEVLQSINSSADLAIHLSIGLIGVLSFWLGLMRIAERAGVIQWLARGLSKLLHPLFPEIPHGHSAMASIALNLSANMLGLGNAATPFGLQAMRELQTLNTHKSTATHAMCMFLALNTSSVQLLPTGALAILVASGAEHAMRIVGPCLIATTITTLFAMLLANLCRARGISLSINMRQ